MRFFHSLFSHRSNITAQVMRVTRKWKLLLLLQKVHSYLYVYSCRFRLKFALHSFQNSLHSDTQLKILSDYSPVDKKIDPLLQLLFRFQLFTSLIFDTIKS